MAQARKALDILDLEEQRLGGPGADPQNPHEALDGRASEIVDPAFPTNRRLQFWLIGLAVSPSA